MEVLSTKLGRAIYLFPVRDMNPRGLDIWQILSEITARYRFLKSPDLNAFIQGGGGPVEFNFGKFESERFGGIEVALQIHEDGLIADTEASTSASEEFLNDFIAWLVTEHGFTAPAQVKPLYLSELYVGSSDPFAKLIAKFDAFLSALTQSVDDELGRKMEPVALNFGYEMTSALKTAANFRFERAIDAPNMKNRFFSSANVTTESHLHLLGMLEAALNS
ncbi:hypothetical protein [Pseudorhodoplanes sp.]|uniref:hypothetical protein n=1 Tax=Pseudorhodoplanes sp. TaxID=1934341 RepID=UPI003D0E595B